MLRTQAPSRSTSRSTSDYSSYRQPEIIVLLALVGTWKVSWTRDLQCWVGMSET